MASQQLSRTSLGTGSSSNKSLISPNSPLHSADAGDLIKVEYEFDAVANIKLPLQAQLLLQQQEHTDADSEACSPCAGELLSYVGVVKVPGRTKWPYRAVLSLPLGGTDASHSAVMCESYYSTPEAAARAVDAICIVLLGRQAAVNFPASSYDAADLEDACKYIRCVSGAGVELGGCNCGCLRLP